MAKTRRRNPNIKAGAGREERDTQWQNDRQLDKGTRANESKSGATGTMRIVVDGEQPYLEVKSSEGWVRSDSSSASGFSFKK
jgi:hypothetical protein|tara:strand:+ start:4363 stop:4608 length:246 start_codon:yes stop_codon:yes gene_type:complete